MMPIGVRQLRIVDVDDEGMGTVSARQSPGLGFSGARRHRKAERILLSRLS